MATYKLVTIDQRFTAETIARTGSEQLLEKAMRSFVGLYNEEESWYIPLRANLGNKKKDTAIFKTPFPTTNLHFKNPGLDFEKAVYVPNHYVMEIQNTLPEEQSKLIFENQEVIRNKFEDYVLSVDSMEKDNNNYLFSTVPLFPEGIEKIKQIQQRREEVKQELNSFTLNNVGEEIKSTVQSVEEENKEENKKDSEDYAIENQETIQMTTREDTLTEEEIQKVLTDLNEKPEFGYMLLGRLENDVKYYLGFGNQHPKHLWGTTTEKHIAYMKLIYDNLSQKPEWLSLEQIEKYAAEMGVGKKEKVKEMDLQTAITNKDYKYLKEHLEKGIESYLDSDTYKNFLSCFSSFNDYSQKNMRLLLAQLPTATMVAKASDWKNLGRYPSKGTKALRIYGPNPEYKKDAEGNYLKDEKGKKIPTGNIAGWKLVPVFDVSQTHGKELPKPIYELTENFKEPKHFLSIFNAVKNCTTASISLQEISREGVRGFYNHDTHSIVIRKGMNQYQTLKTEIHEVAHSLLHQKTSEFISKEQKEFEAESVAYIVCQNYGVDTSDYTFAYLSSWTNKGERIADFENSLKTITNTAREIIKKIDKELSQELTIKENKVEERTNQFSVRLQNAQKQLGNLSEKTVTKSMENTTVKK